MVGSHSRKGWQYASEGVQEEELLVVVSVKFFSRRLQIENNCK